MSQVFCHDSIPQAARQLVGAESPSSHNRNAVVNHIVPLVQHINYCGACRIPVSKPSRRPLFVTCSYLALPLINEGASLAVFTTSPWALPYTRAVAVSSSPTCVYLPYISPNRPDWTVYSSVPLAGWVECCSDNMPALKGVQLSALSAHAPWSATPLPIICSDNDETVRPGCGSGAFLLSPTCSRTDYELLTEVPIFSSALQQRIPIFGNLDEEGARQLEALQNEVTIIISSSKEKVACPVCPLCHGRLQSRWGEELFSHGVAVSFEGALVDASIAQLSQQPQCDHPHDMLIVCSRSALVWRDVVLAMCGPTARVLVIPTLQPDRPKRWSRAQKEYPDAFRIWFARSVISCSSKQLLVNCKSFLAQAKEDAKSLMLGLESLLSTCPNTNTTTALTSLDRWMLHIAEEAGSKCERLCHLFDYAGAFKVLSACVCRDLLLPPQAVSVGVGHMCVALLQHIIQLFVPIVEPVHERIPSKPCPLEADEVGFFQELTNAKRVAFTRKKLLNRHIVLRVSTTPPSDMHVWLHAFLGVPSCTVVVQSPPSTGSFKMSIE